MLKGLQRNFGIAEPRLAVSGLNPHAGENGKLGTEEEEIIAPAIALLAALSSARTDRSAWVFGLALIAVLLVTVFPTVMPRTVMLWAIAGCLSAIGACLMVLQQVVPTPRAGEVVPAQGRLP